MIKQLACKSIKITLFLSSCLLASAMASAAEPTADPIITATDVKREKSSDSVVTLAEFASFFERGLKAKILAGDKSDVKIHANISKDALSYGQFLTQLNINGFTAYKSNDYILIVPNREARNLAIPIVEKHKSYQDDEYVTDILKVEKACANRVLAVIRPIVPQYAHLSVYEEANTFIIVDTYSNIQRVKTVIKAIDNNFDTKQDCDRNKENDNSAGRK